eukprot:INCI8321.3.p1 GENE.INCI8321.3~~INCI8321.3.p1  ORF type:complete len:692 (+),score=121.88 INCI8321.3:84-2159(+)
MFVFTGRSTKRSPRSQSMNSSDEELRRLQQREALLLKELEALKDERRSKKAEAARYHKKRRGHLHGASHRKQQQWQQQQHVSRDPLLLSSEFLVMEGDVVQSDDGDDVDDERSVGSADSDYEPKDAALSAHYSRRRRRSRSNSRSSTPEGTSFAPVFTLPPIETASPTASRPTSLASLPQPRVRQGVVRHVKKSARELEDEQFNALLQQRLGMSSEELESLRAPKNSAPFQRNSDEAIAAVLSLDVGPSVSGRGDQIAPLAPHRDRAHRQQRRNRKGGGGPGKGRTKRRGNASVQSAAASADALRRKLTASIGHVQQYTHSVRHDIDMIRQMAPIANSKARRFMHRWSAEKLFQIGGRLLFRLVAGRFRTWVNAVHILRLEEKRREYNHLVAARRILTVVASAGYRPLLRLAFQGWLLHRDEQREVEEDALNYVHALTIQRQARVWLAHRRRDMMRYRREHQVEWESALRIQTMYRGVAGRKAGLKYMEQERSRRAATKVQRVARGRAGRKAAAEKQQTMLEAKSAHQIQMAFRSHAAKRELRLRKARANAADAATKINALARRVRDRKRAAKLALRRQRARAAARVQATIRGRQERKKIQMLRAKRAMERRRQDTAARKIQAVYRGHRGRLSTYIIMMEHNEKKTSPNQCRESDPTLLAKCFGYQFGPSSVCRKLIGDGRAGQDVHPVQR